MGIVYHMFQKGLMAWAKSIVLLNEGSFSNCDFWAWILAMFFIKEHSAKYTKNRMAQFLTSWQIVMVLKTI